MKNLLQMNQRMSIFFFSTHFPSGQSCQEQAPPNSSCCTAALDHLRLYSKCSSVQRIFILLWKLFSKSFLWMNWQICMVFPTFYSLELVQNLIPSPPACTTSWIWGYFMVMQYLSPLLHFMNIFSLHEHSTVNMKILASKKKLGINLKYMQVHRKGKGVWAGLHTNKMENRYLKLRGEKINQSNFTTLTLPSCMSPPGAKWQTSSVQRLEYQKRKGGKRSLGRLVTTLYFQNVKILTVYFRSIHSIRRASLTGRKKGKLLTLFHGQN